MGEVVRLPVQHKQLEVWPLHERVERQASAICRPRRAITDQAWRLAICDQIEDVYGVPHPVVAHALSFHGLTPTELAQRPMPGERSELHAFARGLRDDFLESIDRCRAARLATSDGPEAA